MSARPNGRHEGDATSEQRMLSLMAYVDGELEGRELEEVERWLERDPNAARFVRDLERLGDRVRSTLGASDAADVGAFDVTHSVMAAVAAEVQPAPHGAPVVSLAAARGTRPKAWKVAGAAAAALALAASVAVVVRGRTEAPLARRASGAAQTAEPGVDVDLVETAGEAVKVFYLSTGSSATTSVMVWVDEPGGK